MKLQVNAPDPFLVERYLEEIARAYDIRWRSNRLEQEEEEEEEYTIEDDDDDDIGGGQAEVKIYIHIYTCNGNVFLLSGI